MILEGIASIGQTVNSTMKIVDNLINNTDAKMAKAEQETQKYLADQQLAAARLQAEQNDKLFAMQAQTVSEQWIKGIDNKTVLMYGGIGVGGFFLLLTIILLVK